MLGVSDPWVLFGLLAFGVAATLGSNWLAAQLRRYKPSPGGLLSSVSASLIWILLTFAAGVVATRYIERIAHTFVGYLVFGLVAFLLSLGRALLYRRVQERRGARPGFDRQALLSCVVHNASYLLLSILLYLVLSWLTRRPADPTLFIPLCIGALLPDLDVPTSPLGRLLPFISRRLEARLGHRQEWHTLVAALLVALITAPLILVVGLGVWYLIPLGFVSHLLLDMLQPEGVMLFWPASRTRYSILGGFVESLGDASERKLAAALAFVTVVLLFVVDLGPPAPPPAVMLSYEQTLERYYGLRGRNLVFASVEGTWQATGRRIRGRFEILTASGQSFIMLDRFTGRVFTAGRAADDNLYVNGISLQTGSSARIKPVELHLEGQFLAEVLPAVYQMQREPGLQHIFVSGDVVVPLSQEDSEPALRADYAQTQLRKIQARGDEHYRLNYLSASELIELANLRVEIADLVIVATYESPATGPTPTPLPSPPPVSEGAP